MKISAKITDVTKIATDLVAVFCWEKEDESQKEPGFVLSEEAAKIDIALGGGLKEIISVERHDGKSGKLLLLHTHDKLPAKRVVVVGLGNLKEATFSDIQADIALVGRKAKEIGVKKLALALPAPVLDLFSSEKTAQIVTEGLILGTYTFLRHKKEDEQKKDVLIEEAVYLVHPARLTSVSSGIAMGLVTSRAVCFSRDLVNEPPSLTTPSYLAKAAQELVKGKDGMSCEILGSQEMKDLGMGALLGIARGSDEEPRFIHLDYNGGGGKTVAIVGKGITFDTGGLSLKPSSGMETMKLDMSGAAAVLGVFKALGELKPKIHVVGLIAATENMPSGNAIKPGDIVRAMNGKTIEVLNTDAEGRVVLADAFSYAELKVKPQVMIDLATLTGACMVALGEDISGLFSNDEGLTTSLKNAAQRSGEKIWELPLAKEYKKELESTVADLKNVAAGKYGGAINGALFLEEFVPKGTKWAHLDIAGPSFAEKDAPLTPRGGTGFGVRLLLELLMSFT